MRRSQASPHSITMSLIRLLALLALLLAAHVASAEPDPKSDEFWYGAASDGTPTVRLYYFFSPTCPHCQAAAPFIDELKGRWPWLEVEKYSVKDNRANARFYYETALSLGTKALSVPGFVFCRQVLIGYDTAETTGAEIARAIEACHQRLLDEGVRTMSAAPAASGPAGGDAPQTRFNRVPRVGGLGFLRAFRPLQVDLFGWTLVRFELGVLPELACFLPSFS